MKEARITREETLLGALEGHTLELYRVRRALVSWAVIIIGVVLAALALFMAYVSARGLGAIQQNTRAIQDAAEVSRANRAALIQVEQGFRSSVLQLEVMRRQLDMIERRLGGGGKR